MMEKLKENINDYEKRVIQIMVDDDCTFSEAMLVDFEMHNIDTSSVFSLVDYLEQELGTLDKVEFMMDVFVGRKPDMVLKPKQDNV